MMHNAKDENLKRVFAKKLIQVKNMDDLQQAARQFQEKTGRGPDRLDELVEAGLLPQIPEDPYNAKYRWDVEKTADRSG